MKECSKCNIRKEYEHFGVVSVVKGQTYYRRYCKACSHTKNVWGFDRRLTPADRASLLAHETEFMSMTHLKSFYELAGLSMTLAQYYRYLRDGSFRKFYEVSGAEAQKVK